MLSTPGVLGQIADTSHFHSGLRDFMVVFHRAAAHADGADQYAIIIHDRQAAGESDQSLIGMFDAEKRLTGLRKLAQLAGWHGKVTSRFCFLHCYIDAADPCIVHAPESFQVGAGIQHRNATGFTDFLGLGDGGSNKSLGLVIIYMHLFLL